VLVNTFEFVVVLRWKDPPAASPDAPEGAEPPKRIPLDYLTPDGGTSTEAGDALRLTFRLWPTMRENAKIEARLHDLNGGRDATLVLARETERAREAVLDAATAAVLGGRAPGSLTPEQAAALKGQVDAYANLAPELQDKRALAIQLMTVTAKHDMAAAWPVLGVNLPAAWRDIADVAVSPSVMSAILAAYSDARNEAIEASGKTQPSPR
jgi:hypothetical protein